MISTDTRKNPIFSIILAITRMAVPGQELLRNKLKNIVKILRPACVASADVDVSATAVRRCVDRQDYPWTHPWVLEHLSLAPVHAVASSFKLPGTELGIQLWFSCRSPRILMTCLALFVCVVCPLLPSLTFSLLPAPHPVVLL